MACQIMRDRKKKHSIQYQPSDRQCGTSARWPETVIPYTKSKVRAWKPNYQRNGRGQKAAFLGGNWQYKMFICRKGNNLVESIWMLLLIHVLVFWPLRFSFPSPSENKDSQDASAVYMYFAKKFDKTSRQPAQIEEIQSGGFMKKNIFGCWDAN